MHQCHITIKSYPYLECQCPRQASASPYQLKPSYDVNYNLRLMLMLMQLVEYIQILLYKSPFFLDTAKVLYVKDEEPIVALRCFLILFMRLRGSSDSSLAIDLVERGSLSGSNPFCQRGWWSETRARPLLPTVLFIRGPLLSMPSEDFWFFTWVGLCVTFTPALALKIFIRSSAS